MKVAMHQDELRFVAEESFIFQNAELLKTSFLNGIESNEAKSVALDLSDIQEMDSLGIKVVLGLYKTCQSKGLPFHIDVASPVIIRLLRLCHLDRLLTINEVTQA